MDRHGGGLFAKKGLNSMLDFICEFDKIVHEWQETEKWPITKIAELTSCTVPQAVDYLSDALGKELEVQEELSFQEGNRALNILKKRMETQLAARERRIKERTDKAMRSYDLTMEKVRVLLMSKNWRSAYKTLSYFVGSYEKDIPQELLTTVCGECLRLGIKSAANLQEIGYWLQKAVQAGLTHQSRDAVEDVFDLIDTYSDYFTQELHGPAHKLISSVVAELQEQAVNFELINEYTALRHELKISASA